MRDIAVLELLFATGIRVSELCALKHRDVNIIEGEVKIYGKGAKERLVQIGNPEVKGASGVSVLESPGYRTNRHVFCE